MAYESGSRGARERQMTHCSFGVGQQTLREPMKVTVTVDPQKCVASEMCVRAAPGNFELGAEGVSRPTREMWTAEDLPVLREAEENCPTAAITVTTG